MYSFSLCVLIYFPCSYTKQHIIILYSYACFKETLSMFITFNGAYEQCNIKSTGHHSLYAYEKEC